MDKVLKVYKIDGDEWMEMPGRSKPNNQKQGNSRIDQKFQGFET